MTSYVDNKNEGVLGIGESATHNLDNTTITAEAKYLINVTESGKRFVLNLHHNGSNNLCLLIQ